jgi:hypothetical protein
VFGPFGSLRDFGFGMTTKMREEQQKRRDEELKARLAKAEHWTAKTPWRRSLTLTAESWQPRSLFTVEPTKCNDVNNETKPEGKFVTSPNGRFLYVEKVLPKEATLALHQGSRRGTVMFDGPVRIPSLHERSGSSKHWRAEPWMSHTPSEVITQRPGLRLARGHVVVAGLGLGWALVEVFRKRTVSKVTLVEISQELVDWVMPALAPHLRGLGKDFDTIIGDAHDVLIDYAADVALIDIFEHYGSNDFYVRGGKRPKNIPTVWCWGSASMADEGRGWF